MKIFLTFLMGFSTLLWAQEMNSGTFVKQKREIRELKQELNSFYKKKEEEYQTRKAELDRQLAKIESEKKQMQAIYDKNLEVLNDIQGQVQGKTTKIYNSMKPKNAAQIFNKMIDEGNIQDVFDIILKLKEKNVTLIMKFLSVSHASELTRMLENYKLDNELKDNTNG